MENNDKENKESAEMKLKKQQLNDAGTSPKQACSRSDWVTCNRIGK